ncbi:helix-turn-helix domain-containing protein [Wenyingzhuangia marina]|uniref:Transcriptional regulator, AraC family n=1 Tax=Wenyingzhuangia marina TaxID=1195760 RepID=A0A1M5U7B8_9FLAO|nr:AraC family transcriptional regulator [Wenyingzhuangia marina]GGF69200.1 AraC family transcriptional regulator [Wenyingzhuangia marina]SHH58849.1 transcriptional regulator, AraC family [Wenyingzhuangia marina]
MIHFDPNKYKNIDKSTATFLNESQDFSILQITNHETDIQYYKHSDDRNYIYVFFNLNDSCKVAFNMEHCAVNLEKDTSCMVYFKETEMNLLFELPTNSNLIVLLIPVQYFHSLFTAENNYLFNYDNFIVGKPIIEKKDTNTALQVVLHQLATKPKNTPLHTLFIKGKVYELLSLYFSNADENTDEKCPFMANEDTINQLRQVKNIIIDQMADPPSLEELSKTVGLNIKKLKQGFKEVYGAPVFTFLLNYKLEYSKKLLIENLLNVNEIGNKIGYSNSSHFIAAFKRKFGVTPKQFTKQINT